MIKVLELFAGIGACSKALERLGIEHEIVDAVEIDNFAIKSFNAIHGTNFEPQDITKWDKDVEVDLIMHRSPCQDFSIAGKQAGGDEGSGTRSSLMYETLRIVEKLKPEVVIWENVRNLLSGKHKHNFETYIDKMSELGYESCSRIINSKDYGVPQSRERVFTISIRVKVTTKLVNQILFPAPRDDTKKLKDILEKEVDEKYYLSLDKIDMINSWKCYERPLEKIMTPNAICGTLTTRSASLGGGLKILTNNKKGYEIAKNYDTIDLSYPSSRTRRGRIGHEISKTITTNSNIAIIDDYKLRKLTPLECWRLMGFDDEDFYKAKNIGTSDSQLYKQAGNSIVVNVLEAILTELFN